MTKLKLEINMKIVTILLNINDFIINIVKRLNKSNEKLIEQYKIEKEIK